MTDAMDPYLRYLKERLDAANSKGAPKERAAALAEFNRALAFARRQGQTIVFAI
jgi:hypothetical protein